jgi:pimeloyl-ACP methyl ester carboxylesterase
MQDTREFRVQVGDDELFVVEWPGTSDPILLLHATGFHSRCWNQVVARLPGQHVYAVDLRFHGASDDTGEVDWTLLAEDIRELIGLLDLRNLVGVGHSIGGHLIVRAAAALPERFKQLVLVDPVIMSPDIYARMHEFVEGIHPTDHPVSRRKNQWRDANQMYDRFRGREPFASWRPEVLRDYCDYALRPVTDADYLQLACDPINEAAIYLNQAGNDVVHEELSLINTPTTLLRAPPGEPGVTDLSNSPTWQGLAEAMPCCREIYLPDMDHFIPMRAPELVAEYIQQAQNNLWRQR